MTLIPFASLERLVQSNPSFILTGNGTKSQFANLQRLEKDIDELAVSLSKEHGDDQPIVILYGGDPYNKEKPDIAHVARRLKKKHGFIVCAIQSDIVEKEWGGCDSGVCDFAYYFKTDKAENGDIIWSGFHPDYRENAVLAGSSKIWFSAPIASNVQQFIAFGGGPIAKDEAMHAKKIGMPVLYIRSETRFHEVNGKYGSLDEIFRKEETRKEEGAREGKIEPQRTEELFWYLATRLGMTMILILVFFRCP
jgi:hypothetical protein